MIIKSFLPRKFYESKRRIGRGDEVRLIENSISLAR